MNITPKQAAVISALVTAGACTLLTAYPLGYFFASRKQVRQIKKAGGGSGRNYLDEYNKTVIAYNTSVVRFNRALEERYEQVPPLKEMMDLQVKQAYDAAFEEIMRKEF